jgi:hypothetical protein
VSLGRVHSRIFTAGADFPQYAPRRFAEWTSVEAIVEIDDRSRVVGLGVEREAIRSFL